MPEVQCFLQVNSFAIPFVCYQTCEHDILKMNEPRFWHKLAQVVFDERPQKDQRWESLGQRSRSYEAEIGHKKIPFGVIPHELSDKF